jgi:LmbE family N-acetylglucosaminyl deacetylase
VTTAQTAESAWVTWPFLDALPALSQPTGRVVVVSAHPDDEVLGAGGLLASLAGSDADLRFVVATDGEASHGVQPSWLGFDLGARRARELVDGLHSLGYDDPDVTRLRLPDTAVSDHVDELAARLRPLVAEAHLVLCPSRQDGHIDHATVGQVAGELCLGLVPLWEYPIWTWHWTAPGDPGVSWHGARRFDLAPAVARCKQRALTCFGSQLGPLPGDPSKSVILPPDVLAHFQRPYEVFLA